MSPDAEKYARLVATLTAAQMALLVAVDRNLFDLVKVLRLAGFPIGVGVTARPVIRLARTRARTPATEAALRLFEARVRPSLLAYLAAARAAGVHMLHPEAEFLVEHFDQYAEVPVTASRIHRVVIWARRTLRALREALRHDQH